MRIRPTRPAVAFALLSLGVALASPAPAETPGAGAEPEAAPAAEEAPAIDLEALAETRAMRARMEQNRVRPRVQRYLTAAAEATDSGVPGEAQGMLERLEAGRLNSQERALVSRLKAFVLYSEGNMPGAIKAFEAAIAEEILPLKDEVRIRFNIAQLQAGLQNWQETIDAIHAWLPYVKDPDPLGYYLLAIAHFQLDQFDDAIRYAEKALDLAPEPKEGWLQLLAALYVQKEDYVSATPVLEELVLRFPKKLYWVQLSLIYGARENYRHSLAVQQVAYAQGLLVEDKELRRLARSYLFADLPYPAAQVLEKGLAEGKIEGDVDAYEMLANSWIAAREYDRSLAPLQHAAELSEDGQLYVRLAQVHIQREEWNEAIEMLDKAVAKGGLDKPGNALLLLGISYYNQDRLGKARSYFARAAREEDAKPQARRWLKHLDEEAARASQGAQATHESGALETQASQEAALDAPGGNG